MGQSNNFKCTKCNKYIMASMISTEGMNSKVLAVKCNDCQEVGDSLIETSSLDGKTIMEPLCNECGSANVIKWDGKCPKCNIQMVDDGRAMMWD